MALKRFWFTFRNPPRFSPLGIGCGVTAYDREDAQQILTSTVFASKEMLSFDQIVENIDVSELDPQHVLPNMGSVAVRGVWFPLGYSMNENDNSGNHKASI